jgi:mevalonate kinase
MGSFRYGHHVPLEMTLRESACGKIILLGEHAVVYGYPAVAVPVSGLRAYAELLPHSAGFLIDAPDIGLSAELSDLPPNHPLGRCIRLAAKHLGFALPSARLRIESDIPVASGLGSGAAVSTAIVRVLASAAARSLPPAEVSGLVLEVENLLHGTPSGVDNTVIAYEQPVFFIRGEPPVPVRPGMELEMIIADSGLRSETRKAVDGVRQRWQQDPGRYDSLFRQMGTLTESGCCALQAGDLPALGRAMNSCHDLLVQIDVSLPVLDRLVEAARAAGSPGAKLSGAGLGGNVVALVQNATREAVRTALRKAGAAVEYSTVLPSG